MIICIHCLIKRDESFYSPSNIQKHNFICRDCSKIASKQWRDTNKKKLSRERDSIYIDKVSNQELKFCQHCENRKLYSEFAKNYMKEDGCVNICKDCMIVYGRQIRNLIKSQIKTYTIIEKCCQLCKETKPTKDFNKTRTNRDGYSRLCKKCNRSEIKRRRKLDPARYRYWDAIKLTKRLQRYVAWADFKTIKEIYKKCPTTQEVDHIVPLQGILVSGLHVHSNLQYLSKPDNMAKLNHIDLDAYNQKHMPAYIVKINLMLEEMAHKAPVAI